VPNITIKFKVNEEPYTSGTDSSGNFSLTLNLPPANNQPTTYHILASFEGDENKTATAYATTPNGTQVPVCTTLQYGFKPSSNGVSLTVEPQSTGVVQPTKTPEQIQREQETGNQLTTEPKFSWWDPWFWLQTTVSYLTSELPLVVCTALFNGWLQNFNGLVNLLFAIFEGVLPLQIEILTAVAVATIATTVASFIGGYIALLIAGGSILGSFLLQMLYIGGFLVAIGAINALADAYVARAILITIGWTLLTIATLGYARIIPLLLARITGGDVEATAVRTIISTLLGITISTAILKAMKVNAFHFTFYLANIVIALFSLGLGYSRV